MSLAAVALGCGGGRATGTAWDASDLEPQADGPAPAADSAAERPGADACMLPRRVEVIGTVRFVGVEHASVCPGPESWIQVNFLVGNVDGDRVRVGCDGRFRISLWPGGPYRPVVTVSTAGHTTWGLEAAAFSVPAQGLDLGTIAISLASVGGTVRVNGAVPAPGQNGTSCGDVHLEDKPIGPQSDAVISCDTGAFETFLPRGRYRVFAGGPRLMRPLPTADLRPRLPFVFHPVAEAVEVPSPEPLALEAASTRLAGSIEADVDRPWPQGRPCVGDDPPSWLSLGASDVPDSRYEWATDWLAVCDGRFDGFVAPARYAGRVSLEGRTSRAFLAASPALDLSDGADRVVTLRIEPALVSGQVRLGGRVLDVAAGRFGIAGTLLLYNARRELVVLEIAGGAPPRFAGAVPRDRYQIEFRGGGTDGLPSLSYPVSPLDLRGATHPVVVDVDLPPAARVAGVVTFRGGPFSVADCSRNLRLAFDGQGRRQLLTLRCAGDGTARFAGVVGTGRYQIWVESALVRRDLDLLADAEDLSFDVPGFAPEPAPSCR